MSTAPSEIRLTGRAARFLFLLRDFGHLTDEGMDQLMLGVADLQAAGADGLVDLDDVRKAASVLLFAERDGELGPGVLAQDWNILFS